MAVQKNFKITNGLEVNNNLIFANKDSNKVGIATTNPQYTLSVNGGIGVINSIVTGVSTVNNIVINGRITAGSSLGASGQYLISTGDGVSWTGIPKLRTVDKQIAGVGATTFNTTYSVGLLDVFINGVRLSDDEFTADDSATVVLDGACFGGETVEFISYSTSGLGVGFTGIQGLTILEEGSPIGSPLQVTSINFVGGAVTAVGSGVGVTVFFSDYISSSGIASYSDVAGISTYSETSGISSYSDVAGISTYSETSGISSYSDVAGISTYSETSGISSYSDVAGISTNVIGGIASVTSVTAGIVTATDGFISVGNTTPIQISLDGDQLTFTAVGIGSTTLTLF
jgi:hypothetical protein